MPECVFYNWQLVCQYQLLVSQHSRKFREHCTLANNYNIIVNKSMGETSLQIYPKLLVAMQQLITWHRLSGQLALPEHRTYTSAGRDGYRRLHKVLWIWIMGMKWWADYLFMCPALSCLWLLSAVLLNWKWLNHKYKHCQQFSPPPFRLFKLQLFDYNPFL